jgi:adenosylhomocysteine nucleosidase
MSSTPPIGIIAALPQELTGLVDAVRPTTAVAGIDFRTGRLAGHDAVFCESGIGKVNAAIRTTVLMHTFDCRALVFSGVAGGVDPILNIGDVVIADRLVQYDYGALRTDGLVPFTPGVPPLPGFESEPGYVLEPALLNRVLAAATGAALPPLSAALTGGVARTPQVVAGTVVTGDAFVNSEPARIGLYEQHNARAVEMEGAAVAQVADHFGVPLVVIRCLSDLAGTESYLDFGAFLPEAALIGAAVTRAVVAVL